MKKLFITLFFFFLWFSSVSANYTIQYSNDWINYTSWSNDFNLNFWNKKYFKINIEDVSTWGPEAIDILSWWLLRLTNAWLSCIGDPSATFSQNTDYHIEVYSDNPTGNCYIYYAVDNTTNLTSSTVHINWNNQSTVTSFSYSTAPSNAWSNLVSFSNSWIVIENKSIELTRDSNDNFLKSIFQLLKFVPTIAALAAWFFVLNKIMGLIPRAWWGK